MTTPSKIFVKIAVTNQEFIKVLTQLGFREESTERHWRFVNNEHKSEVVFPIRPLNEAVPRIYVAEFSYRLYMQGVIRDEENLVKKVLQNRWGRKKYKLEVNKNLITAESRVLAEKTVTNREFLEVLKQLGFRDESTEEHCRFINDAYKSIVSLPVKPLDDIIRRQFLRMYSLELSMHEVIKEEEDLVKKVLQNREHQ